MELVTSLSVNELAEVCAAINSMHNEAHDATSADVEQESEATQVVKYSAQPKPAATGKATDTTHIVPIQPTARVGNVTRTPNKTSHGDLLNMARIKVGAQFGGRQRQESLIMSDVDEAPERRHWFDTNDEWFAKRKV